MTDTGTEVEREVTIVPARSSGTDQVGLSLNQHIAPESAAPTDRIAETLVKIPGTPEAAVGVQSMREPRFGAADIGAELFPDVIQNTLVQTSQMRAEQLQNVRSAAHAQGLGGRPSVPGYEVQEKLGKGGEGEVWRGVRETTGQVFAIKVFNRNDFDGANKEFHHQRALAEHLAAHLNGEGSPIATISEAGQTMDGRPFIVMNLISTPLIGRTAIRDTFERTGTETEPVLKVSVDAYVEHFERTIRGMEVLARALHKIHLAGLIHRDIKPDNMAFGEPAKLDDMIDDGPDGDGDDISDEDQVNLLGKSKFLDLGLMERIREKPPAKLAMLRDFREFYENIPKLTLGESATISGTIAYMAPEVFRGEAGKHSDQYAFGMTIYELLTGTNPRARDAMGECSEMPPLKDALPREFLEKLDDPSFRLFGINADPRSLVEYISEVVQISTDPVYENRHKDMKQFAAFLSDPIMAEASVLKGLPQATQWLVKRGLGEAA